MTGENVAVYLNLYPLLRYLDSLDEIVKRR